MALMALRMQITSTPTSPKIAIHMFTNPSGVRNIMANLIARAMTMFCTTMLCILLYAPIDSGTLEGLSSMITTSAASIAASDPIQPMAMPTSARASYGESLIPSPTKTVVPLLFSMASSSLPILSSGSIP